MVGWRTAKLCDPSELARLPKTQSSALRQPTSRSVFDSARQAKAHRLNTVGPHATHGIAKQIVLELQKARSVQAVEAGR